ncbi:WD repeat-containing protein [Reticulomyxa filosa]|uniref:WD repeat-containing protein n=1 Tax=Reticulomyxa filosa TaxID=46433 RepID=X6NWX5_RETFI|nr:WD repeat-containing protein [Reticulomyxa filosa]|eukprot:ETO30329.1 WD repeat-containing protein [Reticulomyxa filosa]
MRQSITKTEEIANIHTAPFETLATFPIPLQNTQSVAYKHEILIFAGYERRACYSYHILKNEYKLFCLYPNSINVDGHCVVKLVDNNNKNKHINEITLLSFGGKQRHSLIMKYISAWDNDNEIIKKKNYNRWFPFIDNNNNPVQIAKDEDNYNGVRAVIGGNNNNLLFITYNPKNISVFDLTKFQFIKHDILPIDINISFHCFVKRNENENGNKEKDEMWLFCFEIGLSIEYDEKLNTFQFHKLRVCDTIKSFHYYAYSYIQNSILFFGGCLFYGSTSNQIHKYSIINNKWMKCKEILSIPLKYPIAILTEDNLFVHILGVDDTNNKLLTHIKMKISDFTEGNQKWMIENKEIADFEEIRIELEEMNKGLDIKYLKKKKEIAMIIKYWMNSIEINELGWIDEFNLIILRYILQNYFKPFKVFQGHFNSVNSIKFSPDCTKIISTSNDKTIKIWDITSGHELQELKGHFDHVKNAIFSPDGNMVVSCSNDNTIRLWDVESCTEIRQLNGHTRHVRSVQFSPNGKIIVSGSLDKTVRLWSVESGKEIKRLNENLDHINDVNFSPNGQQIAIASDDFAIRIWNVRSNNKVNKMLGHSSYVMKVQFSPDGSKLVSCSTDRTIRIWDAKSRTQLKKMSGYPARVTDVKFSSDGQTIISGLTDYTVRLWDVNLGVEKQRLKGHHDDITGIDISIDDNTIVSSSRDGTIRIWNIITNRIFTTNNVNFFA